MTAPEPAGRTVPPHVSTRFRAPTHVHNVIERRRLLDRLRADGATRLVVIHAPAGYGKTTLAVQRLREVESGGALVAWLGLHDDDNAPHWFLSHLLGAVRTVLPDAEESLRDLAELIEQNAEDTQRYVLSTLLELLGAAAAPVVLTFDDWHLIDDAAVHHALVHLLDFAPSNLSVVLTSRRRPRLPLSRLRVRGQLVEIDADALRFDLAEAREFLVELNGLTLHGDDVARLSAGTDGWVAALQLVSLSLRDCADPEALIRGFSGRHHSVGEYLTENVLDALPADLLDALLTTSVCDRLCGDLASELTGRTDGQAVLEELEIRNLFLRPLDDEREWFRYHHLFADHLRRRLRRDHPDRVAVLHLRASDWFARAGLAPEAVSHALAAGEVGRATDLVEQHAMSFVEHSRMVSLLGLMNRLPSTAADDRPRLLMAVAWANCLLQRTAAAQAALDLLRSALPRGDAGMEIEADVVQACIDIYNDRTDRAEGLVRRSLDRPWEHRPWVVAVGANIQTFCDFHATRHGMARERQRWARPFHDRTTGSFAAVYGRCFAGIAALSQLAVDAAEEHLTDAVELARSSAGQRSHAARLAAAMLGELHYMRGRIDAAERLLEECGELGAESGVVEFMAAGYALRARVRARRGAVAEAAELLAEGAQVAERLGLVRLRAAIGAERIVQLLDAGKVRDARRVAQELPDGSCRHGGIAEAIDRLRTSSLAAVLSAEGDHEGAAALLENLVGADTERGCIRSAAVLSVQLAGVQERAALRMAAERTLAGALDRVLTERVPQIVRDGGPSVRAVVERLVVRARAGTWPVGRSPFPEQLETLLGERVATVTTASVDLTGRELEILRMLDVGRTNQQVARSLSVTVNTVKWYLKNIYGKLGAGNRTEAVSVARRHGLLA
ncbi:MULTISPECIES: LuxR C-terminal-related transcriptional regulator [Pseudonocardia]|uniref:Serine/threonine-protein kinase PknK n=2 Tax=Pseudonocardia TaxID=1847 RepID=A0A1Y2MTD2_PSEAH|nr:MULTISPECIES: LuxR C-terminal-related transcriptional regulator [Pseudonocardia]OSY38463.1 Serine/threonine-protein kinase PknK [Pseudonocardia autotrophica]TDN77094.1 LuxR family maltose regulon positive regulatory protein/serine/threonine-protein kinase PknK [Pseudonocardia autotrophica]BBG01100.1 hypothetical protein Pdca_23090 [Pseudonocardia autotrophica]GEC28793.1 hypothetical protein PSA01_58220 [Pseudonocardia saturnea]